jgi:hypothetical protein
MSDIDHIAEAKKSATNAAMLVAGHAALLPVLTEGLLHAAIAQAEATAALAGEKRIANLIAVGMTEHDVFSEPADANPYKPIFAAIREGLGIA